MNQEELSLIEEITFNTRFHIDKGSAVWYDKNGEKIKRSVYYDENYRNYFIYKDKRIYLNISIDSISAE